MPAGVSLVSQRGPTSIHIRAYFNENGELVIEGQDIGEAPRQVFGDLDYEYWLTISPEHLPKLFSALTGKSVQAANAMKAELLKDKLLQVLFEHYAGDAGLVTKLRNLLNENSIPGRFHSY